jgi:hypothetical protein
MRLAIMSLMSSLDPSDEADNGWKASLGRRTQLEELGQKPSVQLMEHKANNALSKMKVFIRIYFNREDLSVFVIMKNMLDRKGERVYYDLRGRW